MTSSYLVAYLFQCIDHTYYCINYNIMFSKLGKSHDEKSKTYYKHFFYKHFFRYATSLKLAMKEEIKAKDFGWAKIEKIKHTLCISTIKEDRTSIKKQFNV